MTVKPEYTISAKPTASADLSKERIGSKASVPSSQPEGGSFASDLSTTSFSIQTREASPSRCPTVEGADAALTPQTGLTQDQADISETKVPGPGISPLKSLSSPPLTTAGQTQSHLQIAKGTSPYRAKRAIIRYSFGDVLTRVIGWLAGLIRKLDELIFTNRAVQVIPPKPKKLKLKRGRYLPIEDDQSGSDIEEDPREEDLPAEVNKERGKKLEQQAQVPKRE